MRIIVDNVLVDDVGLEVIEENVGVGIIWLESGLSYVGIVVVGDNVE